MRTHELAKLLLESEDKPVYIENGSFHMGEYVKLYEEVVGLNNFIVEDSLVFKTETVKESINDVIYKKGDAKVFLGSGENKKVFHLSSDYLHYLLFEKGSHFYNSTFDSLSFYQTPNNDIDDDMILNEKILLSLNTDFHPEWKEMKLEEAKNWYIKNQRDQLFEYEDYIKD